MPSGLDRSFHPSVTVRARCNLLLVAAACLTALGCAAIEHGLNAKDYAGEALSSRQARGAERLRAEMDVDASVADYVAEHGKPDYLYVVDRQKLYLFYVKSDKAAKFERVLVEASTVEELGRIPGNLLKWLPAKARSHIETKRSKEQRRAQNKARKSRAAQARSPKRSSAASRAPSGTYLAAFQAAELVSRMREPVTAADPGVANWRRSEQSGRVAWSARAGRTEYEVSADRAAFTTPISASRGQLPGAARIAIRRINNAIFAAKAGSVNSVAIDLAERAASDRTGRTQFQKRVAGRTLRVGRLAGRGVFAYSVHP